MTCTHYQTKMRQPFADDSISHAHFFLTMPVIVPVFCACMLAASGNYSGVHTGILRMQYQIDDATEYIAGQLSDALYLQTYRTDKHFSFRTN